ncbi:2OG-Fe(II) oxygenase [Legionella worsleiensis]|uniref:SM-20-like protein n=1 Tax=Legionella worsleiensis TaxID=45076 RepID=A0A0W1AK25_9GAMM|nr:2OG-Fe(II) oxygenase [Legionella worsleiensis]KTD81673.1 SM-20-like protein [Legionella worsleiensis]STY31917.1 SM-20-like protein [Legionella worsleiensis]
MLDPELISHNISVQGYHLIDEFIAPEHYKALIAYCENLQQQGLFRNARIGHTNETHHNNAIRTDAICWLEEQTIEPCVQTYLKRTNELACLLNRTLFLGLTEFETHFAVYQPGTYYKKHIDQFATKKTRKISCVYYLNEAWQEEFGGELILYSKENHILQKVSPKGNRFICFDSELPHEVCLTHHTRYSITGWMKTAPTNPLWVSPLYSAQA